MTNQMIPTEALTKVIEIVLSWGQVIELHSPEIARHSSEPRVILGLYTPVHR